MPDTETLHLLIQTKLTDMQLKAVQAVDRLGAVPEIISILKLNNQYKINIFLNEMRFGCFVRAATEEGFTLRFDDLAIWLIEEE